MGEEKIEKEIDDMLRQRMTSKQLAKSLLLFGYDTDSKCKERITNCFGEVLDGAGDDILEIEGKIESVIILHRDLGFCREIAFFEGEPLKRVQIIFRINCELSDDWLRYLLAHELGHACLHHYQICHPSLWNKVRDFNELAADRLAQSWGFPLPKSEEESGKEKKKKGE